MSEDYDPDELNYLLQYIDDELNGESTIIIEPDDVLKIYEFARKRVLEKMENEDLSDEEKEYYEEILDDINSLIKFHIYDIAYDPNDYHYYEILELAKEYIMELKNEEDSER